MKRNLRLAFLTLLLAPWAASAEDYDPEASAGALQNRAYSMTFEINVPAIGTIPLDAFYKGYTVGGGIVVHFSDYIAWQVGRGAYSFNVSTSLRDQLERDFAQLPTAFDEASWFVGSDLMIKPFYGKSSVLNSWVLHYEAYFLVGVSVFKFSTTGFAPAVNLGGGLRLFHTKRISYRADVTDNVVITSKGKINQVIAIQLMLAVNLGIGE